MTQVAVLGTGIMGSAMARNLLRAGLAVTVWDRSPEATAGLEREGARAARSPAEAVRDVGFALGKLAKRLSTRSVRLARMILIQAIRNAMVNDLVVRNVADLAALRRKASQVGSQYLDRWND